MLKHNYNNRKKGSYAQTIIMVLSIQDRKWAMK